MRRGTAAICLIAMGACAFLSGSDPYQKHRRPGDPISPTFPIYSLKIQGLTMLEALLAVGRQLHIPLGIRYLDMEAVEKPISISRPPSRRDSTYVPVSNLGNTLDDILRAGFNYAWKIRGNIVEDENPNGEGTVEKKPFGTPIQINNLRAQYDSKNLINFRLSRIRNSKVHHPGGQPPP